MASDGESYSLCRENGERLWDGKLFKRDVLVRAEVVEKKEGRRAQSTSRC